MHSPPFSSKFTLFARSMQMDAGPFNTLPAGTMLNFVGRLDRRKGLCPLVQVCSCRLAASPVCSSFRAMLSPGPSSCRAHHLSSSQSLQGMAASSTQQRQLTSLLAPLSSFVAQPFPTNSFPRTLWGRFLTNVTSSSTTATSLQTSEPWPRPLNRLWISALLRGEATSISALSVEATAYICYFHIF